MKRLWLGIAGATLVLSVAAFTSAGGWAVVKVRQAPDAWIAGRPLELAWEVRAHGTEHLRGLRPTIEARAGSRRVTGTAWAVDGGGERGYRGRITLPEPGDWQLTVHSGFGKSRAVLLPLRAVDSVTRVTGTVEAHLRQLGVPAPSDAERGRRAFAALGCVSCHVHRDVEVTGEASGFGPELTDRQLSADYLARFLADPSIKPPSNGRRMPNLALGPQEIAPLVAFLTTQRRQARR